MDPSASNTDGVKVSVISPSAYVSFPNEHFASLYSTLKLISNLFFCVYFRVHKMHHIHRIRICHQQTALLSHNHSNLLNFAVSITNNHRV